MSLLHQVVSASFARGTHHKLALDALHQLRGPQAQRWSDLLLSQHAAYLEGAKAPDDRFKDFKNHVLHVRDNFWGGAVKAAQSWYAQLVDHLREGQWTEAAFAAGVLSHYVSDPLMPLHTGQSEAEGAVHRAAEWSAAKSYDALLDLLARELGGFPRLEPPPGADWLAAMIRTGAEFANPYYELIIDHYNLAVGVKDPPCGLDRASQEAVARCLGLAIVSWARILERAIAEAAVTPPAVSITLAGVLAAVQIPIRQVVNKLADARDRQVVEAIYREVQATGKAIESLPADDKLVRQLHAVEVLRVPLAVLDAEQPRPAGAKFGQRPAERMELTGPTLLMPPPPSEPVAVAPPRAEHPLVAASRPARFYLRLDSPIVDAPSIGPKTAARLEAEGVRTVADLLAATPEILAEQLATRHITANTLRDWQAQAQLVCRVPGLRGHDAQLLVAAGLRDAQAVAAAQPTSLCEKVRQVAASTAGQRILRDGAAPDLAEVAAWIAAAVHAEMPRAA